MMAGLAGVMFDTLVDLSVLRAHVGPPLLMFEINEMHSSNSYPYN